MQIKRFLNFDPLTPTLSGVWTWYIQRPPAATQTPAKANRDYMGVMLRGGTGRTQTTSSRPSGGCPVATRPAWPGNMRCETALNVLSFFDEPDTHPDT